MESEMRNWGHTWNTKGRLAQDRSQWRTGLVYGLRSSWSLGANHHEDKFYNNCLISCGLIGSFLSSIREQTDKILSYASFQQFNVQLSYCQPFNQWDFIDFLK